VIDTFTRECLATTVGPKLKSENVVETLTKIVRERGVPSRIFCDNGSEFADWITDLWAYTKRVIPAFSRPGKPTENAFIRSFNGSFRDECLNLHWFKDYKDANIQIESWRSDYNQSRPHRALNNLSPNEYAKQFAAKTRPL
jgi:putative transposase